MERCNKIVIQNSLLISDIDGILIAYLQLTGCAYPVVGRSSINGINRKRREKKTMAVIHLTEENFEKEVLQSDIPVLVDFWAPWCGPCKMLSPIIDEVAEEVTGVKVCKVNTDEADTVAFQYKVMSIPTLILFKNGTPAATSVGAKPKSEILEFIKS